MRKTASLFLATAVLSAAPALAQTQPTTTSSAPPATTRADPRAGTYAVVDAVVGKVQVKLTKDGAWQNAVVGMELNEGAEIRTGLRSSIRCVIPPDQTFTLDRLGTIALTEAIKEGNLVKTDLTLKYGRAQYRIEKAGLDHDASLSSPSATLAVRGTTVELEDSPPFAPRARSYTGRAAFNANNKQSIVGSKGGTTATMDAGQQSAANTALLSGVIDPTYSAAQSKSDSRLIANQTSLGATARFDREVGIPVIENGPGPTYLESDLLPKLPGTLDFVIRWTGNGDVNLEVGVDKGNPAAILNKTEFHFSEFLYPGYGLNVSPSGGRTDFDDRGGPNGGQEIVYWKGAYPTGVYGLAIVQQSGEPTNVTVNAFLNGKKLLLFDFIATADTVNPVGPGSTTFTYKMKTGDINAPLVFIPLTADNFLYGTADNNNGAAADLESKALATEKQLQASAQKVSKSLKNKEKKAAKPLTGKARSKP